MPDDLLPTGGSLEPIMPPVQPSRPASQLGLILFALVCSNIFALFVTLVFEFLSLRGVVDVSASRFVLVAAWGSGVIIICAFAWGKGIRAKWRTVCGGSLLLAGLLLGLDFWAPKPEIIVDPSHMPFEAGEVYSLTVKSKVDFNAYSVQLKMKLSQFSSADFSFDTPSPRPILEGSALTDIQGLRCVDRNKQAVVMFWIYRMEPGSTREINVTHNSNSHAVIDSKVTYFTSKQVPRTADKTKATGTFHFDEPLTCNGDITFQLPTALTPPSSPPTFPAAPKISILRILHNRAVVIDGLPTTVELYISNSGPQETFTIRSAIQSLDPKSFDDRNGQQREEKKLWGNLATRPTETLELPKDIETTRVTLDAFRYGGDDKGKSLIVRGWLLYFMGRIETNGHGIDYCLYTSVVDVTRAAFCVEHNTPF
jgi:hypothetical protein